VADAGGAGGVDGVAVRIYAGGVGDGWVGDEEELCCVGESGGEGFGGGEGALVDVEGEVEVS
jgi:hypothetical protein